MSTNREAQVDLLLAYRGTPRHRLFEYPHRADDSRRYIKDAEQLLDAILALRTVPKAADAWLNDDEIPPVSEGQVRREVYTWRGKRIES